MISVRPSDRVLEELLRRVEYKPDTGEFFWKCRVKGARWQAGEKANGTPCGEGGRYRCVSVFGHDIMLHNAAYFIMTGEWPKLEVDHEDHNRTNNAWNNLRLATRVDNNRNHSLRSDNTSGHVGVSWNSRKQKWKAQVSINGKCKSLGYYFDIEDAIAARQAANKQYGFHENHGAAA